MRPSSFDLLIIRLGAVIFSISFLVACAPPLKTYPAGGTPIKSAQAVVGTWKMEPVQFPVAGVTGALRFMENGNGLLVIHQNYSNTRAFGTHNTYQSTFRYFQGEDTLRVVFGPIDTISGTGDFLIAGWRSEAPVWLENDTLRIGRKFDQKSIYTRAPDLNSFDLTQYGIAGGLNTGLRGTRAGFHDAMHGAMDVVSVAQGAVNDAANFQKAQQSGRTNINPNAYPNTTGGAGMRTVNGSFTAQEIQQMYGSSAQAMDFQINRGKDVVRYYGIPKAQAEQMIRSAETYTAAGHESVNVRGKVYTIQQGQSYKVGQEFVR